MLREDLPGLRVLDDERARRHGRRSRVRGSGEGERREDDGADPQEHEREGYLRRYLMRIFCPTVRAVGSMPRLRVVSSSTVVLYFWAMEPSVSPLTTT